MLDRRALLSGLLVSPAIVRHENLMRLSFPESWGLPYVDNGAVLFNRVGWDIAKVFHDANKEFPAYCQPLLPWKIIQEKGYRMGFSQQSSGYWTTGYGLPIIPRTGRNGPLHCAAISVLTAFGSENKTFR